MSKQATYLPLATERPRSQPQRLRGPFHKPGWAPQEVPALRRACCFDRLYEPCCLWRPGPHPCYRDCVSSPALGILAVPGESARRGLGPISSSLAQALPLGLHPWEQGERVPSGQTPSWGASLLLSENAEQAGPASGPLPWLCWLPGAGPQLLPCCSSPSPPQRGPDRPVTL